MSAPSAAVRGTLHLGDFHPDLEAAFAACLRELAPGGDARRLLVLTPNRLLGVHLRRRAAQLGVGTFGLRPRALEDLTTELAAPLLAARGWRALEGWELPLLASEILGRSIAGSAPYFANSAARPGLYRALAGTFRDLRDAGVESEALAQAAAGISPKLEQVAELYRRFVAGLVSRRLADAAAVGEAAAEAVAGASALPQTVLAYGFYELVGRQRRLLEALLSGRHAEVFFPWGENPAFAYAAPLRDWFLALGLVPQSAAANETTAAIPADLAALRRGLFAEPGTAKRPPRAARDRSVRFVSAPTAAREAVEVLRRLVDAPSRSAAVLLRHADEDLALWSGARRSTGVPVHLGAGDPWLRRPAGRAARLLLALAAGRRPSPGDAAGEATLARSEVEDLLATGALASELFARGSHPERWTQVLRRRGLVGGLAGWERLRELGQRPAPGGMRAADDEERDPLLRRELPALGAFVIRLLEDTAVLAADAQSWAAWWQRLRAVLERWLAAGGERDGVLAALQPLARLDGVVKFDWHAALASAEGLLGAAGPAAPNADAGERFGSAPTVAALAGLRGLSFERVVIPGLVERSFPRRGVQDAILLDRERESLNERLGAAAIPSKLAGVAAEERFLFRLAIGAARQEVVLSWPRHAADGRRVVPSSFALAAGRALLGREVMFEDLERHSSAGAAAGQPGDAGPLGLEHAPLSPVEAARLRKGGDRRRLPPLLPWEFDFAEIARVDAAAHRAVETPQLSYLLAAHPGLGPTLAAQRGRRGAGTHRRLTAWDGLIGPELAAAWWERNRTESGAFRVSPSALELYALCSFKFFHEKVLGLQSEPAPERRLDLDQRDVGALVHRILERLYGRLERDRLLPLDPGKLAAARAAVEPVLDAVVAEDPALIAGAPLALWRVRRRRLIEDLEHLVEREAEAGQGWRPLHRELAFGVRGQPPVEVTVAGERLALRGRLDRLDVQTSAAGGGKQTSAAGGGKQAPPGGAARLRVIDYKTGKLDRKQTPEPPGLLGGRKLQLPLYRLAAAELAGREVSDIEAAYLGVERLSGFREVAWNTEHFAAAAPRFETIVGAILRGVRAGEFFQVEREVHCEEQCAFKEICGPGRAALIEAKRVDQRVTAAELWRVESEES